MTLTEAVLILLLAARIHGADDGVRQAAKNIVKKLPRSERDIIYDVIASKSPMRLVQHIALNLD